MADLYTKGYHCHCKHITITLIWKLLFQMANRTKYIIHALIAAGVVVALWIAPEIIGGTIKDLLPDVDQKITFAWKWGFAALVIAGAVGFFIGCIYIVFFGPTKSISSESGPPAPPPMVKEEALQHLRKTRDSAVYEEVINDVIEDIVIGRENDKEFCRKILIALSRRNRNIMAEEFWEDSGLRFHSYFELVKGLRGEFIRRLRDLAIPSLDRLVEKLGTIRNNLESTYQYLEQKGL